MKGYIILFVGTFFVGVFIAIAVSQQGEDAHELDRIKQEQTVSRQQSEASFYDALRKDMENSGR